jgi:hypothetical protein
MDKALETQLSNIQKRTGKTLDELVAVVKQSGLAKHGQIVAMLKDHLGMGHGDANTIVHFANKSAQGFAETAAGTGAGTGAGTDTAELDRIYTGPKAALRPIHEKVMASVNGFGPFEIAPKKTYLSLRRKKQFATVGPATNTRVEIGLNMRGVKGTSRLEELPAGGMCQYRVKLTSPAEVDAELIAWIRMAYDTSG